LSNKYYFWGAETPSRRKMNKFDIFVDSSANLTDEMIAASGIKVISYICTFNGEDRACYEKGTPFKETAKKFYNDILEGAEVKTSLLSEAKIVEAVTPSLQEGKDVLFVTIASGISGTYNQVVNAQKTLNSTFKNCHMYVVDSANASLGEGLLALNAAKLRDLGESCETCAKWIEENKYKMNSYVTVNDLKYLRKGGRISATLAIAGTLLNIKPMLRADGATPAKLSFYSKERGRRKAIDALLKAFDELCVNPETQTIAITHCDCEEEALKLAESIKAHGAKDVVIEYYDLCTGAHVGPGTIALFFMGKDRRTPVAESLELNPAAKRVSNEA
jgi:DegV family protein with EDD domain